MRVASASSSCTWAGSNSRVREKSCSRASVSSTTRSATLTFNALANLASEVSVGTTSPRASSETYPRPSFVSSTRLSKEWSASSLKRLTRCPTALASASGFSLWRAAACGFALDLPCGTALTLPGVEATLVRVHDTGSSEEDGDAGAQGWNPNGEGQVPGLTNYSASGSAAGNREAAKGSEEASLKREAPTKEARA